jgi:PAS domain-containing protein
MTGKAIHYERYNETLGRFYDKSVFSPLPGYFAIVFDDITERKLAEEALRKSEARYRSLFENNLEGIFLADLNGTITDANPAACAMLGMSKEEIIRVGRAGLVDPNDPRLAVFLEKRERITTVRL